MLQQLADEEGKNHALMERTRREHVTEMILEPITGLHKKDYDVDLKHAEQKDDAGLLRAAVDASGAGEEILRRRIRESSASGGRQDLQENQQEKGGKSHKASGSQISREVNEGAHRCQTVLRGES